MSAVHLQPPNRTKGQGGRTYQSTAFEQKHEAIRTGPGVLNGGFFYNKNAAKRWVFITDAITAGALDTCIIPPIPIGPGEMFTLNIMYGRVFSTGLSVALSSTDSSYTAASTDLDMTVQYAISQDTPTSDA